MAARYLKILEDGSCARLARTTFLHPLLLTQHDSSLLAPLRIHQSAHPSRSKQHVCCCRYLRDAKDLQKYAASLHLMPEPPDAIAVHNLAALVQATRYAARLSPSCGAPGLLHKLYSTACHSL
jgi:hypothetical protein